MERCPPALPSGRPLCRPARPTACRRLSGLLRRETGRTFSEILLEQRMTRAACLLRGTPLSIENIAAMLGYRDSSNFYKAFREYYGKSPREYIKEE